MNNKPWMSGQMDVKEDELMRYQFMDISITD
jgi:hypothetical protein